MSQTITLSGSFTFESYHRIEGEMAGNLTEPDLVVDLSGIGDVDSCAISVLLHWRRAAGAAGRKLRFETPPAGLLSLAHLYGVEELLELQ